MRYYSGWAPYVSVAERKRKAQKKIASLKKKGQKIFPVTIEGRNIANTFWGQAWCKNLESHQDYENRLPRGRSYVRNGSVVHLNIEKGLIESMVQGSDMYNVKITITPIKKQKWNAIIKFNNILQKFWVSF